MFDWLFKWIPEKYRDTAERLVWTALAWALAQVPIWLADADQAWSGLAIVVANWLLIQLRKYTPLPSPGTGLPGAPVEPEPAGM